MTNPLETLLRATAGTTRFAPNSRYHGLETATLDTPEGTIVFLRRRFVPGPERFALLTEHTVIEADRTDNLAARYLGDPELYWRLCDANNAMLPDELTDTVGRRLRIVLPEGMPGTGAPGDV
jgi:hypothetical protein